MIHVVIILSLLLLGMCRVVWEKQWHIGKLNKKLQDVEGENSLMRGTIRFYRDSVGPQVDFTTDELELIIVLIANMDEDLRLDNERKMARTISDKINIVTRR